MKHVIKEVTPELFLEFKAAGADGTSPDRLARLILAPVPFPRAFFFAYPSGSDRPVARLGVSQSLEGGRSGGLGFQSGEFSALVELIQHAEGWLGARGAKRAIGPIVYSTWFSYRARLFVDGDESPTFKWEPNQPRGEEAIWEKSGYSQIENFSSRALAGLKEFADGHESGLQKALREGFTFSSFTDEVKTEESRRKLLDDLYDLTMESFSEASFFESISREQFHSLYVAGFSEVGDLSFSYLMRDEAGRPAAFSFAFLDSGYLVLKTLAVAKRLRGRGLSNGVLALSSQAGLARNAENMIHALMRQGNKSENFGEKSKLLWEHRYGLFAKPI